MVMCKICNQVKVKVCNSQAHCNLCRREREIMCFLAFNKKDDVLLDN